VPRWKSRVVVAREVSTKEDARESARVRPLRRDVPQCRGRDRGGRALQADGSPGLATGSSPVGVYRELIRFHRDGLSFAHVTCFNLDEYLGLAPDHAASYRRFMRENLFDSLDVPIRASTCLPASRRDYEEHCAWYERRIHECGGIDVQLLGLGAMGTSGSMSRDVTRIPLQRPDPGAADHSRQRPFLRAESEVPVHAVTMGVATILEARASSSSPRARQRLPPWPRPSRDR